VVAGVVVLAAVGVGLFFLLGGDDQGPAANATDPPSSQTSSAPPESSEETSPEPEEPSPPPPSPPDTGGVPADLPPGEPAPTGGEPGVQSAADACAEGLVALCDVLRFFEGDPDLQPYADYGRTCGGRNESTETLCTDLYR